MLITKKIDRIKFINIYIINILTKYERIYSLYIQRFMIETNLEVVVEVQAKKINDLL